MVDQYKLMIRRRYSGDGHGAALFGCGLNGLSDLLQSPGIVQTPPDAAHSLPRFWAYQGSGRTDDLVKRMVVDEKCRNPAKGQS